MPLLWRAAGLAFAAEYMAAEDLQTNFVCIGPVNKVLNMLACYHVGGRDTGTPEFQKHLLRVADYLWPPSESRIAVIAIPFAQNESSRLWCTRWRVAGSKIHEASAIRVNPSFV